MCGIPQRPSYTICKQLGNSLLFFFFQVLRFLTTTYKQSGVGCWIASLRWNIC